MKTLEDRRAYEKNWYKTTGKDKRNAANTRWQEKTRIAFKDFKSTLKCARCPETHITCLEFHHLDPSLKEVAIGSVASTWSLTRIKKELEKCIVLCANCHRKEHYKE